MRRGIPRFGLLLARDGERALEIRFRFRRIRLGRHKCDFADDAIGLSLASPLLGGFNNLHRIVNAVQSVIRVKFCISPRQIG